ncbi:MAG: hypothetical protein HZA89_02615 [Verrucomicrobia bacterium]|nr:hypothetical protein [Verrucomicrobiota bacterium]
MIKEFAIEPCVLTDWRNFQSLFDDFGVGKGRLISRYPKDWTKEVDRLLAKGEASGLIGPVKAKTIREKIFGQKHKLIPARRDYPSNKTWLENAESCQSSRPFHAIIAEENPRKHQNVIGVDDLDKGTNPYHVQTQIEVKRSAGCLASCAKLLLNVCEEIKFIDPHFDPNERRFRNTFCETLRLHSLAPQGLKVCEIHTKRPAEFRREIQLHHFRSRFEADVPSGTTLRVFFWQQNPKGKKLHPRFLLTEFGGLQFDYGLDEGDEGDKTIVTLMEEELWRQAREDYSDSGSAFEIDTDGIIEVAGRRPKQQL